MWLFCQKNIFSMYLKLLKFLTEPYYWFYILCDAMFFYHKKKQEKNHRWWLPSLFENICQHDFSLIDEGFRCNNRWRSERDLNSRTVLPVYELSKPTSSASWVSLQSFSVVKRQHYYFIEFGHDVKKKLIETRKHGDKNGIILAWNTKLIEIIAIRESINS